MMTNFGGNCNIGMVLFFGLFWLFCYMVRYLLDFLKGLIDFTGNYDFGEVLCF